MIKGVNFIYNHMAAVSKNVYFNVLDVIDDKYNNTYHNTIKTKPIDARHNSWFFKNFFL